MSLLDRSSVTAVVGRLTHDQVMKANTTNQDDACSGKCTFMSWEWTALAAYKRNLSAPVLIYMFIRLPRITTNAPQYYPKTPPHSINNRNQHISSRKPKKPGRSNVHAVFDFASAPFRADY